MGSKRKAMTDLPDDPLKKQKINNGSQRKTPTTGIVPVNSEKKITKKKWKPRNKTVYRETKFQEAAATAKDNDDPNTLQRPSKTSSCMKHKKKDKKTEKVPVKQVQKVGPKQPSSVPMAHLPKTDGEISSNWRELIKSDKTLRKKKMKKAHKLKERKDEDRKTPKPTSPPEIWFDDVDDILLPTLPYIETNNNNRAKRNQPKKTSDPLVKAESFAGLTKIVAMDCEMVGVGLDGKDSILARVSLVNQNGQCVYDRYVRPTEEVTDYRTHVSGIRKDDIEKGDKFDLVQKEVSDILNGRILVGHAVHNDLKVMYLSHPKKKTRDTQRYRPFVTLFNGRRPSLKKLTEKILSVKVQEGEHSSVQDAQAAMRLYTMYRKQWEKDLKDKFNTK